MKKHPIVVAAFMGALLTVGLSLASPEIRSLVTGFPGIFGVLAIIGGLFGALIGYAYALFNRKPEERTQERDAEQLSQAARGKGTLGLGIVICIVSVIWFFVGVAGNRIFLYPPILLVFGLISIARGLARRPVGDNEALDSDALDTQNGG